MIIGIEVDACDQHFQLRRKPKVLLKHWRRRTAKTLIFCNISVITENIYLKLGACVHYPKNISCYQGRQFKLVSFFFFFSELCSFFDIDFLSSIKHPTAECWHSHVMLLFPIPTAGFLLGFAFVAICDKFCAVHFGIGPRLRYTRKHICG